MFVSPVPGFHVLVWQEPSCEDLNDPPGNSQAPGPPARNGGLAKSGGSSKTSSVMSLHPPQPGLVECSPNVSDCHPNHSQDHLWFLGLRVTRFVAIRLLTCVYAQ